MTVSEANKSFLIGSEAHSIGGSSCCGLGQRPMSGEVIGTRCEPTTFFFFTKWSFIVQLSSGYLCVIPIYYYYPRLKLLFSLHLR